MFEEIDSGSIQGNSLEDMPAALLKFDREGTLIESNSFAEDLLQKFFPDQMFLYLHEVEEALGFFPDIQASMESKELQLGKSWLHIVRKRLSSKEILIWISDISGQKLRLEELHQQVSDILWKVRSRLTPLQNALHLFKEYGGSLDDETKGELLNASGFEMMQIERYLDNFRDLALYNGGVLRESLLWEDLEVNELIDSAVNGVKTFLEGSGEIFEIQHIASDLKLHCDKLRVIRVLQSLILNGIVYSEKESKVEIRVEGHSDGIQIYVKDYGLGIDSDEESKVFNYGFRGRNARKISQNGMGCELFLARQIMLYHNGMITFQTRSGEGSEFTLAFPGIVS
jgi:K+-sensing histidine kinase KdpD